MLRLILCFFLFVHGVFTNYVDGEIEDRNVGYPSYVTEYIEKGKIMEGQKNCSVNMEGKLISYSGFITVVNTPDIKSYLYFWFFLAEINPKNASVMIWLQGGPGSTSLFGLFEGNGPFYLTSTQKLHRRKEAWTKYINILYVDSTVGAGFSYTTNDAGYAKNEDDVGKNLVNFIVQFFTLFPNLQQNDFFVAGESYGGKYVATLAYAIDQHNAAGNRLKINLKGIAIGNGFCDPENMLSYDEFLYQTGLIDSNGKNEFQNAKLKITTLIQNKHFKEAYRQFDAMFSTLFYNLTGYKSYFNFLEFQGSSTAGNFSAYVQSDKVRRAIHVGNIPFYKTNPKVYKNLLNDIMQSVKPIIESLLEKGYKSLIYSGQLDIIVAYRLTVNFLEALSWSGKNNYLNATREKFIVDGALAGYYKEAQSLVEVMVRNAGHVVPQDQPLWALELIKRFTYNGTLKINHLI